ncbi:MAG: tyrosine-type recombinase/integrase [Planctomycetota bacterium]|nr:tyrosine-type recombinase/integrase [Planctomycetota bacterium]
MKVYRPTFTEKLTGKTKKCSHWYITFIDNLQVRRRLPAFANRPATDRAAVKLQELLNTGGVPSQELQAWLEKEIPAAMRERLVDWRIVDNQRMSKHLGATLAEHLADFRAALEAKGDNAGYARRESITLNSIFSACGFKTWTDLDANRLYTYLAGLRGPTGISQRTFNAHLKATQHFARWMIKERRATDYPLEHLSPVTQTEFRRQRRALTLDEQRRLLTVTAAGPVHHTMTGAERSLIYRLALETGLRAGEIGKLTVLAFDFDACTVSLAASCTKNKRDAEIDLKPSTAAALRAFMAGRLPHDSAFTANAADRSAEMLRLDLEAAGIDYSDDAGRVVDFHALRHTFITTLSRAGVNIADVKVLARHSTITLTEKYITLSVRPSLKRIINEQPDLSAAPENLSVACLGSRSA